MLHNKKPPSAQTLLKWYDKHRRKMPWRALPGKTANPYHVWLSEIMLQQTTVVTVKPYFEKFIALWPTIEDLARASQDDVLTQWAGLGYYNRARNLHKTAKIIVSDYQSVFPKEIKELKSLPGIGDYTANAIRAIAYDKPATVVDGNVERVIARLFTLTTPLPKVKKAIKGYAESLSPIKRPGDYAQAMMDLGATICTPKNPKCPLCPWRKACFALEENNQEKYPVKPPKKKKPIRYTTAFVFTDRQGRFFLRRREEEGLLAGMMEVPSTQWLKSKKTEENTPPFVKKGITYKTLPGDVRHVFTHFELRVQVVYLPKKDLAIQDGVWVAKDNLNNQALPTLMKKIITYAS